MIYESLDNAIHSIFGEDVVLESRVPASGGDINLAYALELSNKKKIFMKANRLSNMGFFEAEAEGLSAIRATDTIRVPEVLALGKDGGNAFLLMEYIEPGRGGRTPSEVLGTCLARMHKADTAAFVKGGKFGFLHDNYIGAGFQINTPMNSWREFFVECRLKPQFKKAEGYFDSGTRKKIDSLLDKIDRYLPEPAQPSLLHGDLWAGNYMIDSAGNPWLIDPAAYVGNAEADLAMTELFGGFDRTFYDAYRAEAGIDPGYKERRDLYNLYHLLNHLNLFGSGYYSSVKSILDRYC